MSLEIQFNEIIAQLLIGRASINYSPVQLIECIDLTLLDENASFDALNALKDKVQKHNVAAVCVYSKHITHYSGIKTPLATVINFPSGNQDLSNSLNDITTAIDQGAREIDYVLPYQDYLKGETVQALHKCEAVANKCKDNKLTLKIILETGAFPSQESIYKVSKELISIDCDFIKTSTGKISQGASLSAAFAILGAIKDCNSSCGIKISGGIKTTEQALNYTKLATLMIGKEISANWFRIGASSLLDELVTVY